MAGKQDGKERLRGDDALCRKVAVWLCDNALRNDSYDVKECYALLKDYVDGSVTERMLQSIRENRSQPDLTEAQAVEALDSALTAACRQIELWAKQPGDTNARFFRMKCNQVDWEA